MISQSFGCFASLKCFKTHRFFRNYTKSTQTDVDVVIIGGGIVGLACMERLTRHSSVVLLEQCGRLGMETTARNSQVIHAGLYYPVDSLKTKFCIEGKLELYKVCKEWNVGVNRVGKWIVANSPGEVEWLHSMKKKADELNVETRMLSKKEMMKEPLVNAMQVLYSPTTGIVDVAGLLLALEAKIVSNDHQGDVVLNSRVMNVEKVGGVYKVTIRDPTGESTITCRQLLNSAGLYSDKIANMILARDKYRLHPCIGRYFSISHPNLTQHLIYPAPEENMVGIGVHLTLDLDGKVKFGPDAEYLSGLDLQDGIISGSMYQDPKNVTELRQKFHTAISRYLPSITLDQLQFDYSGIRPKLSGPGQKARDFIVQEEGEDGFEGCVNLIGIESPGVTSSLAIARHVAKLLGHEW